MTKLITFFLLVMASFSTLAFQIDTTYYSKINLTYNKVDNAPDDWKSNNSNIGMKGKYPISDSLDIVFQLEQGIDVAHGDTQKDTLLNTRNTYLGLNGNFGKLLFGTHDTPTKTVQGKIDQFNNVTADIKQTLVSEVRARDAYLYQSPKMGSAFQLKAMYLPSDSNFDASKSISGTYQKDKLYLSLGVDADLRKNDKTASKTKVYDTVRLALAYQWESFKLGGIYQLSEQQNQLGADQESGFVVSAAYKYRSFNFRGQIGQSDIIVSNRDNYAVGVDYIFGKKMKLFVNHFDQEDDLADSKVTEVGIELKI